MVRLSALLIAFLLASCSQESTQVETQEASSPTPAPEVETPPNFLILVADDLGVTSMSDWGINDRNATTTNLSQLAKEGMRYEQFWSQPVCSPMRVTTLTGRYAFRHGIGGPLYGINQLIGMDEPAPLEGGVYSLDFMPVGAGGPVPANQGVRPPGLGPAGPSPDELFLPAVLKSLDKGYSTAAFGKWHMGSHNNGAENHPNLVGFDHYSGPIDGVVIQFSSWIHVENGEPRYEYGYVDQKSADDASEWISQQEGPWMTWFSFINPHEPYHKPPVELIQSENLKELDPRGITNDNTTEYFLAMTEAMDSLTGQIIASIPEDQIDNTYIIWVGDNGDEHNAYPPAMRLPNKWKSTVYQGGAHVPFIIKGPGIEAGSVNNSLAHVVDIFGTVIELAGGDVASINDRKIDTQPFTDQLLGIENPRTRDWNYTDVRFQGVSQAIRNEQYKLIRTNNGDELYDLLNDPKENVNLVEDEMPEIQQNYQNLAAEMEALLATEPPKEQPQRPQPPQPPEQASIQ